MIGQKRGGKCKDFGFKIQMSDRHPVSDSCNAQIHLNLNFNSRFRSSHPPYAPPAARPPEPRTSSIIMAHGL
eukprot:scaffold120331_cov54-Cyclotella_meneghiniana.AAC.5